MTTGFDKKSIYRKTGKDNHTSETVNRAGYGSVIRAVTQYSSLVTILNTLATKTMVMDSMFKMSNYTACR